VQRGLSYSSRINKEDHVEGMRLFEEAVALDRNSSVAHANLGFAHLSAVLFGYDEDREEALATAWEETERALSLDPNEPMAHFALGRLHVSAGAVEMGIGEMRTAIKINPNFERGHHGLGWAHHYGAGQAESALPYLDVALRLSPRSDLRWSTLMVKGSALRMLGRYEEAIANCREACRIPDCGFLPYMQLAAALAEAGQTDEARTALAEAMRRQPALSISFQRKNMVGMHETSWNSLRDGLRKAGLPEG